MLHACYGPAATRVAHALTFNFGCNSFLCLLQPIHLGTAGVAVHRSTRWNRWKFIHAATAGVGVALGSAFVLKRLQRDAPTVQAEHGSVGFNATVYEVSLIVMAAYAAYLVAEVSPPAHMYL